MEKIISLFQRNYEGDHHVRNEIVAGAEWVVAGEGIATVKIDGTCCMVRDGKLFKRYDAKAFTIGKEGKRQEWGRKPPADFIPAQEPDAITGHWPGWVPVGNGNEDRRHREAELPTEDGTYELCGPKVGVNIEGYDKLVLIRHGDRQLPDCPRTFDALREYLSDGLIEGVVWHHPDGRMVKIKGCDFGIKRKQPVMEGGVV